MDLGLARRLQKVTCSHVLDSLFANISWMWINPGIKGAFNPIYLSSKVLWNGIMVPIVLSWDSMSIATNARTWIIKNNALKMESDIQMKSNYVVTVDVQYTV